MEGKVHTVYPGFYSCIMLYRLPQWWKCWPQMTVVCVYVHMQRCHLVYTVLGAMTLTGLQPPYLAICLSLCHRFPLKLNDELEPAANRHTPDYCTSLACRTHRPTEHKHKPQTGKEKKSCITRATNPLDPHLIFACLQKEGSVSG